ncbi:MAG: hypothetical protein KC589_09185, partial [Nanoarchaeota archaeon]|nr:hypothetical protein [Nanoarchaeota archaeon]
MIQKLINQFLSDNDRMESLVAFFTGDLATIFVSYHLVWMKFDFFDKMAIPIILSIITGFLGGAFAILGKM